MAGISIWVSLGAPHAARGVGQPAGVWPARRPPSERRVLPEFGWAGLGYLVVAKLHKPLIMNSHAQEHTPHIRHSQ